MQQRLPDFALERLLACRGGAELEQRPAQPLQVRPAPTGCGRTLATAVEVDQMQAGGRDQDVVRVQVGMPDAGPMETPDHRADLDRKLAAEVTAGQALGERPRAGDAMRDEVGAIQQTLATVTRGDRAWPGQAQPRDLGKQPELPERPAAPRPQPQIAIAQQRPYQSATTIVAQHALAERARDDRHTAAAAAGLHAQGAAFAPVIRRKPVVVDL